MLTWTECSILSWARQRDVKCCPYDFTIIHYCAVTRVSQHTVYYCRQQSGNLLQTLAAEVVLHLRFARLCAPDIPTASFKIVGQYMLQDSLVNGSVGSGIVKNHCHAACTAP